MADPFYITASFKVETPFAGFGFTWRHSPRPRPQSAKLSVLDLETNKDGLASLELVKAFHTWETETADAIPDMTCDARVRFYVCSDFLQFQRPMRNFEPPPTPVRLTGRGFEALCLQWRSSTPNTWWQSSSFSIWRSLDSWHQRFQEVGGAVHFANRHIEPVKGILILENSEGGATGESHVLALFRFLTLGVCSLCLLPSYRKRHRPIGSGGVGSLIRQLSCKHSASHGAVFKSFQRHIVL